MSTVSRRSALGLAALALGSLVPVIGSAESGRSQLQFEIYRSRKQFRWRLKSGNGQIVATSGEGYTTKAACRNGIELIQREAATATLEDRS